MQPITGKVLDKKIIRGLALGLMDVSKDLQEPEPTEGEGETVLRQAAAELLKIVVKSLEGRSTLTREGLTAIADEAVTQLYAPDGKFAGQNLTNFMSEADFRQEVKGRVGTVFETYRDLESESPGSKRGK